MFGPEPCFLRDFAVDLVFRCGDRRLQLLGVGAGTRGLGLQRSELRLERLPLLHDLELSVFEVTALAAQHVDVGLHGLQLARGVDGSRVQPSIDIVRMLADGSRLIVHSAFLREHFVARLAHAFGFA